MQIFRHFTANDIQLEPFPFKWELSMEAYLVENQRVLALDSDTFTSVEIVDTELPLKQGRASKDADGRIDILATYSQEYIAVVELKLGELKSTHLNQLEDYLKGRDEILKQHPDIIDSAFGTPKWIGVLVGTSIESDLANKLTEGYKTDSGIQIAALTIQRYRSKEGNVFVTTDTYFCVAASPKDTTKYLFDGVKLGKGKLVLEVIKRHVEQHPSINYSELEKAFPKSCQGRYGVFDTVENANLNVINDRKRHFLKPEEIIELSDSSIAVCSQWGIGNIGKFISQAEINGHVISSV